MGSLMFIGHNGFLYIPGEFFDVPYGLLDVHDSFNDIPDGFLFFPQGFLDIHDCSLDVSNGFLDLPDTMLDVTVMTDRHTDLSII